MASPPSTGSPRPDKPRHSVPTFFSGDSLHDPLQLGMTIVGVTAILGGIGWWLDSLLGTFPILMALGAVAGLFGIIYLTYLRLREADRRNDDASGQDDSSTEGR
jgi:F0F1-type ATP synthase assembly protein I